MDLTTGPEPAPVDAHEHLTTALWRRADDPAEALRFHDGHERVSMTWRELAERVAGIRDEVEWIDRILVFDDGALDELAARADDRARAEIDERLAALRGDAVASIVHTSGTTGSAKGCVLTHHNLVWTTRQSVDAIGAAFGGERPSTLLFLPLSHVFARIIQFACVETGTLIGYARSRDQLPDDLRAVRPEFLLGVPRCFEKITEAIGEQATSRMARRVVDMAARTADALARGHRRPADPRGGGPYPRPGGPDPWTQRLRRLPRGRRSHRRGARSRWVAAHLGPRRDRPGRVPAHHRAHQGTHRDRWRQEGRADAPGGGAACASMRRSPGRWRTRTGRCRGRRPSGSSGSSSAPFRVEEGELTPTHTPRRDAILTHFSEVVDDIYRPDRAGR